MVVTTSAASAATAPTIDTSTWPLVLIQFAPNAMTDRDVDTFISTLTTILRRKEKHIVVLDALAVQTGLDAKQRRRFMDFVGDAEMRALSRYKMADVLLLNSAVLRGMLTAVFWMAPPASPTKPFADIDAALPFIKERFKEEGVPFTPSLEARLMKMRRR